MKLNNINSRLIATICLAPVLAIAVSSCNKAIPVAEPIPYTPANSSNTSIGTLINTDTTFSFYKAAATKVNMLAQLSDSTRLFTAFIPNNDAFRASGFPSVAAVNSLPATSLGGIVGYSIIPGEQFAAADVPATFPNIQLPTSVTIGTLPGTPLALKLSTFPSRSATFFYDNNIPVMKPDIKLQNGVVHVVAGIVAPPSVVLKQAIYSDPNLSFFKAAVARADSGQTGLNKIDSLLGYAVTNMTVLVPTDTAFQSLLFKSIYGALLLQGVPQPNAFATAQTLSATPDVFTNPALYSVLSAETVRGIVVYHFLATPNPVTAKFEPNVRVFSVNFSSTPKFYTTLINSVLAIHPGINAQATYAGPFVTSLQLTGYGTFPPGGQPYSGTPAKSISLDHHAVNGVYHVIDQVLLPQ